MGVSRIQPKREHIHEYLATTELEIVNRGCEYTFYSGNKRSIIDITVTTRSLLPFLHDWHVENQDTMSDHRQISFYIWRDKPAPKRIRNRKNTNWTIYEKELEGKVGMWFGRIDNPKDIETELTKVSSAIIQTFEKACPEQKISKRNRVPWWNHELKTLRKKANKAFHTAYRTREQEYWDKHKEVRRAFKKVLRRSK